MARMRGVARQGRCAGRAPSVMEIEIMTITRPNGPTIAGVFALVALLATFAGCGGGDGETEDEGTQAPAAAAERTAPDTTTAALPAGSAAISGVAKFEGTAPKLRPVSMDGDPGCAKLHSGPVEPEILVLGDGQTMGNVLVRVRSGHPAQSYPVPSQAVELDQQGCRYIPHVVALQVGQTLRVLNSDGLLHNVHALPKLNASFNRAMPATVTEFEYQFDKVEDPFPVKCDVHPWMGGWIAVFDHPYYTVTGPDGAFEIGGLPAGTYEIEAWHERLGMQSATVTVDDGGSATQDFTFEVQS